MALQSLARLLRVWVTPPMESAGFRKNRSGYRYQSEQGGLVFIDLRQRFGLGRDFVEFQVDTSVAPAILTEFALRDLPEADQVPDNCHWGNWTVRRYPSERTRAAARALLPEQDHFVLDIDPPWVFSKTGDIEVCGQDLRDQLVEAIPGMLDLLEPERMLAAMPDDPRLRALILTPSADWTTALLLSTRGDSPALRDQLAQIDARIPDNPVTPWVLARLKSGA